MQTITRTTAPRRLRSAGTTAQLCYALQTAANVNVRNEARPRKGVCDTKTMVRIGDNYDGTSKEDIKLLEQLVYQHALPLKRTRTNRKLENTLNMMACVGMSPLLAVQKLPQAACSKTGRTTACTKKRCMHGYRMLETAHSHRIMTCYHTVGTLD